MSVKSIPDSAIVDCHSWLNPFDPRNRNIGLKSVTNPRETDKSVSPPVSTPREPYTVAPRYNAVRGVHKIRTALYRGALYPSDVIIQQTVHILTVGDYTS